MALSNKKKSLLLTTGNKSEIAVGYCTLYGDMCGGYSLLKDVFKTQVYDLAKYLNRVARKEFKQLPIPTSIIEKKPSAELNFNQFDQDSLPPYELLDKILHGFIENNLSYTQLVNFGYPHDAVKKVLNLVRISEFKRRQSAPGARITKSSFGRDWRYPVSNRFSYNGDV